MELRPLRDDEVRTYDEVRLATWRSAYRGMLTDAVLDRAQVTPDMTATRRRWLRDPDRPLHVAVVDEQVVGVAVACPARDDDLRPEHTTELGALYVLPEHWGAGVGRALLEAVLSRRSRPEQVLWVLEHNDRGRRFYERCGFRPDGCTRVLDLGSPVPEVRYRRSSPAAPT